ncbi:MAG TPA: ornithine cyclodeaminase family protein [Anaerolineae bacterium]|nr:ornithine cyclodeaminase family protein [Anaerolineae bacterium]
MPLLLTRKDVEQVLTMKDAIAAVEEGFRQLALGNVTMPQRTVIRIPEHHGIHLGMPAYMGGTEGGESLALKVVTVYHDNPSKFGLPTTIGTLLLNDPHTGALVAIMDAGFLTAMRTGAASGVATKYLAREDARSLGLFGAGVQARTQLMAVCEVRSIDRVILYDLNEEAREKFAAEMSERLSIPIEPTEDPQTCVENDIIVAATSSSTPIFEGSWVEEGTHINGIGSHTPQTRELDTETIQNAKVVTDYISACLAEAGDLIIPIQEGAISEDHIHASLGEIVAGLKPGRESVGEITLFKSVGLAVQDAATAVRVYELAQAAGVGEEVEI